MKSRRSPQQSGFIEKLEGRICLSTVPPVTAPGNFTATTISSTAIRLDFVDRSSTERRFIIERTPDNISFQVVGRPPANSHTFTDLSVDPGTNYNYRIRARAANKDSDLVYLDSPVTTPSPASDDFATIDDTGTLNFYGTIGDDALTVSVVGINVVVTSNAGNGNTTRSFLQSSVQRIQVYGLDGDDRIVINANVGAANISGGDGDDVIYGNSGGDRIDGGDGDDYIRGFGGGDTLSGGNGRDRLFGDGGSDSLDGGNGNDVLHGGDGDDTIFGGNGKDRLYGELGIDSLVGGRGDDVLNP